MMAGGNDKGDVERCVYDWLVPDFKEVFEELKLKKTTFQNRRDENKPDVSDLELISEEIIRGQHVQRTSAWQLQLRRKYGHLSMSLCLLECFHENVQKIWTRFDVDIVNLDGTVCHSACGGSHFSSENLTVFTPRSKLGEKRDYAQSGKASLWETEVCKMSDLAQNWNNLVFLNTITFRLRLYIYREKPLNEAGHLAEYREPVRLCYSDRSQLPGAVTPFMQAVKTLWETKENSDVNFLVEGKLVTAHEFVVTVQSPFLKQLIQEHRVRECGGSLGKREIEIPGVSFPAFLLILKYLYTDEAVEVKTSTDVHFIGNVLDACNKLRVDSLARICLTRLLTNMSVDNFAETATIVYSSVNQEHSFFKAEVKRFLIENQKCLQASDNFKEMACSSKNLFLDLCFQPIEIVGNVRN